MKLRSVFVAALLVHIGVGSFCTMPMASAKALPEQVAEMGEEHMSVAKPMAPAHCKHCTAVHPQAIKQAVPASGCADRCFSQASHNILVSNFSFDMQASDAPVAFVDPLFPISRQKITAIARTTGPPSLIATDTVVLSL